MNHRHLTAAAALLLTAVSFTAALNAADSADYREWEDQSVNYVNTEPMRADCAVPSDEDFMMLLNGCWKFHFSLTPEARPADFFRGISKSRRRLDRRHGYPYYVASSRRKRFDLRRCFSGIKSIGIGHRLHRYRRVAAYIEVADLYFFRLFSYLVVIHIRKDLLRPLPLLLS